MIYFFIFLWLLFTIPSYLSIRGHKTPSTWDRLDLISIMLVSILVGPIIVVIYILAHVPWAELAKPIINWLDKPSRW